MMIDKYARTIDFSRGSSTLKDQNPRFALENFVQRLLMRNQRLLRVRLLLWPTLLLLLTLLLPLTLLLLLTALLLLTS